jgi:hypothetical protein
MGEMRNAHKIWSENFKRERSLGRSRRRWEGNIGMDFRKIGWEVVDWTHLAQDSDQWWALVNTVMNLRVP